MPIVGERKSNQIGRGYMKDPISTYAAAFRDVAKSILSESTVDIFQEPGKALMLEASNDTLKNFFIENSADRDSMSADEYDDHVQMMTEQFINDREAVLENANLASMNPVIGLTFPLHKNLLMNNIFDKGAIPKVVAREPKFTITMETRYLVKPDGTEIDMYKEQNSMTAAIDSTAPFEEVEVALPENGITDIISTAGLGTADDHLSIETYISAVKVAVATKTETLPGVYEGLTLTTDFTIADQWLPVNLKFTPSYGEYDRTLMEAVKSDLRVAVKTASGPDLYKLVPISDVISAAMHKDKFYINSISGGTVVKAVKLNARIDTSSAMLQTCSVKWGAKTDIVEIPSAIPINTTVSPDEVKDVGALYQVNQLSKIMSMFKTVLGNYKDDKIKQNLDNSFLTMPATNKLAATFDFAPRDGYALDHVEWRHKTFFDALDTHVTKLLQVLNDPNMTVTVVGRPDLVRKITPTEYTYQTPSSIGPVELDFVKTVTTSDKRVYQFIGSDKLRGNDNLIVILCPRNTERIVYRIYDYQLYVSNEIRNAKNYALPAIHAFERWKFVEFQPVQARVKVLNPTGLKTIVPHDGNI